jgi:two-component system, NarL family, nitrate/nitrite response regulator NarL
MRSAPARSLLLERSGNRPLENSAMEHAYLTHTAITPWPPRPAPAARVVIADDERIFRASLRQLLDLPAALIAAMFGVEVGGGFEVVGEAGSGQETVEMVRSTEPDLMLLDVCMPRRSGLEALRELQRCDQPRHTIILSGALDTQQLVTAIQLGARGVVRKDAPTELLFEAMTCVVAGASWVDQGLTSDLLDAVRTLGQPQCGTGKRPFGLTRRETEVVSLVVEGCNNREIAQRFAVTEETIKHHLTRIFDKVGAVNRVELALVAARHGFVN